MGNAGCRRNEGCYSADFKEITLAYLGVPWVFTRVLASEEGGRRMRDREMAFGETKSEYGWIGHCWLQRRWKAPGARVWAPLEATEDKEMDSPRSLQKETQFCQHLNFGLVGSRSDF